MSSKSTSKPPQTLRSKLTHELTIFTSYFNGCSTQSCLHGVRYIFCSFLHPIERLFWLILFTLAIFYAYHISSMQYSRYIASPTVISLERDYREWNGTLPAITICYHKRVDEMKAAKLITRLWNIQKDDGEFRYFMDYINEVVNVSGSSLRFNRFVNDKRLEFVDMLTIAREVHPKIKSVISSYDTTAEFDMKEIVTEKGICYTVNSILWPLISST